MPNPREIALEELNHPDPMQCILAAVYLTARAQEDLLAFRIFIEAAKREAQCTTPQSR